MKRERGARRGRGGIRDERGGRRERGGREPDMILILCLRDPALLLYSWSKTTVTSCVK